MDIGLKIMTEIVTIINDRLLSFLTDNKLGRLSDSFYNKMFLNNCHNTQLSADGAAN